MIAESNFEALDKGLYPDSDIELICPHCGRVWEGVARPDGEIEWYCREAAVCAPAAYPPVRNGVCMECVMDTTDDYLRFVHDNGLEGCVLMYVLKSGPMSSYAAREIWDMLAEDRPDYCADCVSEYLMAKPDRKDEYIEWKMERAEKRVSA